MGENDPEFMSETYSKSIISDWEKNKGKRSILYLLARSSKLRLLAVVLFSLLNALLSAFNYLVFQKIIQTFNKEVPSEYDLKYLALVYVLVFFIIQLLSRHLMMIQAVISNKSSIELISLIFHKMQLVSPSGVKDKTKEGEILNFVQIDADKIQNFFSNSPTFLVGIFQLILYTYLLFNYFGIYYFAGFAVFIIMIVINRFFLKKQNQYYTEYFQKKDDRMKLTTQIFNHLKILKLNSWENHFKEALHNLRKSEIDSYSKVLKILIAFMIIYWIAPICVSLSTIGIYFYFTSDIGPDRIFTGLSILYGVQEPLVNTPMAISAFLDLIVSLKRVEVSKSNLNLIKHYSVF